MPQRKLVPRAYQTEAVGTVVERVTGDPRSRVLLVSPGGSGKTLMIAMLVERFRDAGRRVLVLSHRRELVLQTLELLLSRGRSDVGVLLPKHAPRTDADVYVGSITTVHARQAYPQVDVILVDEAHHTPSLMYETLLARCPEASLIGLTATPCRLDGRGLGRVFSLLVEAAKPSELIEQGVLANPRVFLAKKKYMPNLEGVRRSRGDYALNDLAPRLNRAELVGGVVSTYRQRCPGEQGLVFATSVDHSKSIVKMFQEAGYASEHLDGGVTLSTRDAAVQRFRSGETRILSSCMLLSEGFDVPRCKAVFMARPTMSRALYLQQAARGMRWYAGQRPLIFDHAGNVQRFGLPHADQQWTLETGLVAKHDTSNYQHTCENEECLAVYPGHLHCCPECGTARTPTSILPEETNERLAEVLLADRLAVAEKLRTMLGGRGYADADIDAVVERWAARRLALAAQ
jgi:superfamily II DNA or RNA helicase